MSKRARTEKQQRLHDEVVKKIAQSYQEKGYNVSAEVDEFSDPENKHKRSPDVEAIKGGHITIVEVETESSLDTKRAKQQKRRFNAWSNRKDNRHFDFVVAEEYDKEDLDLICSEMECSKTPEYEFRDFEDGELEFCEEHSKMYLNQIVNEKGRHFKDLEFANRISEGDSL